MKTIIKVLLISLFFALIALGLISCGAIHVKKEQSKEKIKSDIKDNSVTEKQIDTNVKTTIETKIDDKNETVTQETVYEPQDNTKESFVIEKDGSKVVLNNAKKIVRHTSQKNNIQTELVRKTDELKKDSQKESKAIEVKYEAKKESKAKEVEKEQFNPISYYIGFAIFIIILGIAYFVFKRFRII